MPVQTVPLAEGQGARNINFRRNYEDNAREVDLVTGRIVFV